MRNLTAFILGAAMLFVGGAPFSPQAADASQKADVFIAFKKAPGPVEHSVVQGFGGVIKYSYHLVPAVAASVPEAALNGLSLHPLVQAIEPDGKVYALDAELDNTWGVKRIGAGTVHDGGNKGAGVKVAVIDSGVDYTHPDLGGCFGVGCKVAGGHDFVNNDADPMDDNGHGTHVAGTVAALDNNVGVVGVAPEAKIYALKVLGSGGSGSWSNIIAALEWAVGNGIQVTNNSYGSGSDPGSTVKAAFDNAEAAGILHAAAAGNSGNSPGKGDNVGYPARYDSVIAVAATKKDDKRASFSSTGPAVELAAPGVDVNSTLLGGGYGTKSGTSMASPHVAGTAALVITAGITDANGNGKINDDVRQRLQQTADDLGDPGKDNKYGYGLVDADEAVILPIANTPPTANNVSASTNEDTPVAVTLSGSDAETCELTFSIVTGPSHGSLSSITNNPCTPGTPKTDTASITYTPNLNFNGSDSFTYRVNDGITNSNTATVSITVNAVNDVPVASNKSVTTQKDTAAAVTLTASDVDNCELVFSIVTGPANGSLGAISNNACGAPASPNIDSASVTYTPNSGFTGSDSFTYKVNDGSADSNTAKVSITVNAVNDAPVANDKTVSTLKDTSVAVTLSGSDAETCELAFSIVTAPANGSLSGISDNGCAAGSPNTDTASVTYTPNAGFTGNNSFTYKVNDGAADSNIATVSITVTSPVLFSENFEGDVSGWGAAGLWHLANNTPCVSPGYKSATRSFYYGQESTCNYNTGGSNTGILTSPSVSGLGSSATLSFWYWREVESYNGAYDQTSVQVSYNGGSTWTNVWYKDSKNASEKAWTSVSLNLTTGSNTIKVRFVFNTVDGIANNFRGWLIDDLKVENH